MILLISGNSCTGKTLMSQTLLEKYHIPYLSIDHLKMGLFRGVADCGFTPIDSSEHIGDRLWPILKGIIMTNIENNQNLIIEGCYILPRYLKDFEAAYAEHIISVFLGFSENYIKESFTSHIVKYRNAIEDRGNPEEGIVKDYINEHADFRKECLRSGVDYFEIAVNYEEEIMRVYDFIDSQKSKMNRKYEN